MFADLAPRPVAVALPIALAILAAGCADTRGGKIPYGLDLGTPDPPKIQYLDSNYKIAPMDKLTIKVFKADELSGDYAVDLAGHISLPLVGEVDAANLTTAELDSKLTSLLGQKYFENPDVYAGDIIIVDGSRIKEIEKQMLSTVPLLGLFRPVIY